MSEKNLEVVCWNVVYNLEEDITNLMHMKWDGLNVKDAANQIEKNLLPAAKQLCAANGKDEYKKRLLTIREQLELVKK